MEPSSLTCANCGAALNVEPSDRVVNCAECGTQVSLESTATQDGTAGDEQLDSGPVESEPREPRPRVFGKGGWIAVLLPFLVYMAGFSLAGMAENARDSAHLKPRHDELVEAVNRVQMHLDGLEPQQRNDWIQYLKWREMSESFKDADHEQTPETMQEAARRLYGDRPGLNGPLFTELRNKAEAYINYWTEYEAVLKGEKLPAGHVNMPGENKEISEIAYDSWYPTYYTIIVGVTALLALIGIRWYIKTPLNFSWLAVAVGVVGIFVWIGLHWFDKQFLHLGEMFPVQRAAFNPFRELRHDPTWMWQFLAIRFAGLVLLVPLIEEFFLRGWLMRYIDDPDWDEIPIGEAGKWALIGVPIYAAFTHPNELIAAVVWFSMVTWLYLRTKSIWNCVIAHAVTNLLLGLYVIKFGAWELW